MLLPLAPELSATTPAPDPAALLEELATLRLANTVPCTENGAPRAERAVPLLADLKGWLEAQLARVSKKSELAVAIRYALSRWSAMTRYAADGRLEIDNNAANSITSHSCRKRSGMCRRHKYPHGT